MFFLVVLLGVYCCPKTSRRHETWAFLKSLKVDEARLGFVLEILTRSYLIMRSQVLFLEVNCKWGLFSKVLTTVVFLIWTSLAHGLHRKEVSELLLIFRRD